ncbi:MAG: PA2169 family four-helix-bundle protein [Flavobacterium sp.]|nr:MAG: PA2169 family four-helix-bundle protein [Flavobacterium sp.]
MVADNAGEPETGNSVSGSLHRIWIDVKSLFGGSDRESILSEAERGEDIIKNAYHSVIEQNRLGGVAKETVVLQSALLDKSHDKIKELRNLAR